ncbi:MAG: hypothetical protein ACLVEC_08925, partial [Romboutsia timonensis]
VAPLIFAVWVSRFESNKLKQEEENKDRILDQRQQKLEKIQDSIKGSIEELTTKHNELVDTQKAVEQNLTELKILSAQSRQANILTLQSVYREFFDKYKQFELDLKEVEKFRKEHEDDLDSHELSEDIVDELYKVYAKIKDPVIRDLDAEKIPMIVFEEYQKLNNILWKNTYARYNMDHLFEHFDETYEEMLEIFEEFKRKLYYQV